MSTTQDGTSSSPRTNRPLPAQGALNVIVRGLLRSPAHRVVSDRLLTITVVGRKSGKKYTFPVGYVEDDGALLIGTAGTWRRNLRPEVPVKIRHRGRARLADAEVITDEERAAEFYRVILAHNPVHGRFAGIHVDPDGGPNRADLRRALANGTAVVRLTPR
jgi:deazaflavin-dependent oxidoreductase (nitroreductase family)